MAGKNSLFKTLFIIAFFSSHSALAENNSAVPAISIIIDDIGYRMREDLRAIAIPGSLAYAIMPHSPHAVKMSRLASEKGKTVILHLPMEAVKEEKNHLLGPGALKLDMTREQFMYTLNDNLGSLPDAIGVNNHMGSLLTRHPGHMEWLMDALSKNNKFYIDSVTSEYSVASRIAKEKNVPYLKRDVFLDNEHNKSYIKSQLSELIRIAKFRGKALGIGHPHPETIQVLTRELQELEKYGVKLVSLKELMEKNYSSREMPVVLSN